MVELDDPNTALTKFLTHVVGVPVAIVSVIALLLTLKDWIPILRILFVSGPEAAGRAAKAVRAGPKRLVVAMIAAQTGLVIGTYVIAHFLYSLFLREGRQISPPYDYHEIWTAALVQDHWNVFSAKVVIGALVFVGVIDFLCLTTSRREKLLAALGEIAGALAVLVLFPGALVLLQALIGGGEYTMGDAGMYAAWAGLLYGWSKLVGWSCEFARLVADHAPERGEVKRRSLFSRR